MMQRGVRHVGMGWQVDVVLVRFGTGQPEVVAVLTNAYDVPAYVEALQTQLGDEWTVTTQRKALDIPYVNVGLSLNAPSASTETDDDSWDGIKAWHATPPDSPCGVCDGTGISAAPSVLPCDFCAGTGRN